MTKTFETKSLRVLKLAVCFVLLSFGLMATVPAQGAVPQNVTVSGVVADVNGEPIIGASVLQDGTLNGTVTDIDGRYTLTVPANSKIAFSFIGYVTQVLDVNGRTRINVTLNEDTVLLDDVVVVGFGTQTKANLTGAVSSVDSKILNDRPIRDLNQGLQGATPGLTVLYTSGRLGDEPTMNIRGTGSLSGGSPLVLVDGVQSSLSMVNPDDVESISVLKDAASASIYGSRAAFGVILITTKQGTEDQLKFDFTASVGLAMLGDMPTVADPEKFFRSAYENYRHYPDWTGAAPESWGRYYHINLPVVQAWKQQYAGKIDPLDLNMVYGRDFTTVTTPDYGTQTYFARVWDPKKVLFADAALSQNYSLRMSGKLGANSSIMASLGYNAKDGVYRFNPEKNDRYNFTLNVTSKLAKWLTSDIRVMASRQNYSEPFNDVGGSSGRGDAYGVFTDMFRYPSNNPYGEFNGDHFGFGAIMHRYASRNTRITDYLRLNAKLVATIAKDWTLTAEYSIAQQYRNEKINGGIHPVIKYQGIQYIDPENYKLEAFSTSKAFNRVEFINNTSTTQVFNAYVNYKHKWGDHNFGAQLGTNIEWSNSMNTTSTIYDVLLASMPEINTSTGEKNLTGSRSENAIAGVFARLNYDYKGRYLLELNGRYDGSSKFPTGQKWAFFPSGSLGWRVSEEPWMQGAKNVINNWKFRFSLGSIGNANVGSNVFDPTMSTSNAGWVIGTGSDIKTLGLPRTVSKSLTWERVTTYDAGVDLGLFRMFDITFDWYKRITDGMLAAGETLPDVFGASAPQTNAGQLTTTGWEFQINFNKVVNKNLSFFASAALSDARSVVTKWQSAGQINGTYEGQVIGDIWGLHATRLLQEDDFVNFNYGNRTGTLKEGLPDMSLLRKGSFKFGPGDVLYEDITGDGKITGGVGTIYDHGDIDIIGNSQPHYEYNFRFGGNFYGFDLNVFFQGVGKREMAATNSDIFMPLQRGSYPDNMSEHQFDYWRDGTEGDGLGANLDSYYPRLYPRGSGTAFTGIYGANNSITNSRYIVNLAYCRLKNVTLGYTLPASLTQKINISKVRVYVSGENLLTFKDKKIPIDPEVTAAQSSNYGVGKSFPLQKTVTFGLQVSF